MQYCMKHSSSMRSSNAIGMRLLCDRFLCRASALTSSHRFSDSALPLLPRELANHYESDPGMRQSAYLRTAVVTTVIGRSSPA